MRIRSTTFVFAALGFALPAAAQPKGPANLVIAQQGYVFAGGTLSPGKDGAQTLSGQLYAEFQIPARRTHPVPIVMIHGGSQTGTNFTGTPDGREGWAQFFLRDGYAVYVVDQPGRGRAAYQAERYGPASAVSLQNTLQRFAAPERYNLWPQAHLHSQWPGPATPDDPVFQQFLASQVPGIADFTLQQELNRDAIVDLLKKIGPAILLTHSQSGAFGWPVADAQPDLVKAIIAVEPNGPPFYNVENTGEPEWFRDAAQDHPEKMDRAWGPTAVPLRYAPRAEKAFDLAIVRQEQADGPGLSRCWAQRAPARQLPNLQKMPILILTAEASYHAPYDHCTVKYLEQAGVHPTWVKLADQGIHGNGHMMMLEKNNQSIASVMSRWLSKAVATPKQEALK